MNRCEVFLKNRNFYDKKNRTRLKHTDIEKKIKENGIRKYSYFVKRNDYIEFCLPPQNPLNSTLFHNRPIVLVNEDGRFSKNGEFGELKFFYISKNENLNLYTLFEEFKLPLRIHTDLTVAFLSMVFASCDSIESDLFNLENKRERKELQELFELLKQIVLGKSHLKTVCIESEHKLNISSSAKLANPQTKEIKIRGDMTIGFIEKALQNYEQMDGYETYFRMFDQENRYGPVNLSNGYKNHEKKSQSYYSSVLFNYLRPNLFNSAFHLLTDSHYPKYEEEIKRLKGIYPRRNMFLFIGKLMMLSGLLKFKREPLDEQIIDAIKKKLTVQLKGEKNKLANIKEKNKNAKDGWIEITLFDKLF